MCGLLLRLRQHAGWVQQRRVLAAARHVYLSAIEMLVVAASFIARVSSDSLLLSSPTGVTSKKAHSWTMSCGVRQGRPRQESRSSAETQGVEGLCRECKP